jgi:hypothetical protein
MGPNCSGTKNLHRRDRHPYQPRLRLGVLKLALGSAPQDAQRRTRRR